MKTKDIKILIGAGIGIFLGYILLDLIDLAAFLIQNT